jgi:hypothetical protein
MKSLAILLGMTVGASLALADNCASCASCGDKAAKSGASCSAKPKTMASKDRVATMAWDGTLKAGCADSRESAFWATAQTMLMTSEDGKMPWPMMSLGRGNSVKVLATKTEGACDKSTSQKSIAKGAEGCCNAKGSAAAYKVWAGGEYHFFGCANSAAAGRSELNVRGLVAGSVQPVLDKRNAVN